MAGARYPSLDGKNVLITGGASGIGAAMVEAFLRQGARVTFLDIDEDAAEALRADMADAGLAMPLFDYCDVTDTIALQSAVTACAKAGGGRLDVLVNNAARDDRHEVDEVTAAYWQRLVDLNLKSQFFAAQAAARVMAPGGVIINMGSVAYLRGMPGMVCHTTAKGGITALTRTLAREYGPDGIRVVGVLPGAVDTERQRRLWITPELEAQILERQAIAERIQPEDVAALVLFLASADARACTGQEYIVDLGLV
ncbi:MAG: SDR family NAD(P)-dependent oxidoreductase [Geminicoccaceae bacterium]